MTRRIRPHSDLERRTEFGKWLTVTRKARGLYQDQLATMMSAERGKHYHSGRIAEWETGERIPDAEELEALRRFLDPDGPPPPTPVELGESPKKAKKKEAESKAAGVLTLGFDDGEATPDPKEK